MSINKQELDRHITGNWGEDSVPPEEMDKQEIIEFLVNRRFITDDEAASLAELSIEEITAIYDGHAFGESGVDPYIDGGNQAHDFDEPPAEDLRAEREQIELELRYDDGDYDYPNNDWDEDDQSEDSWDDWGDRFEEYRDDAACGEPGVDQENEKGGES